MSLKNAFCCATVAVLLTASPAASHAVDPGRHPSDRDSIIPQPQDPLFPTSNSNRSGNPGGFDPFAPTGGFGSTQPSRSENELRVNPNLHPNPNPSPSTPRWRLGVYSMDTRTGVQVVRVTQGSPAHAAGLEPDDMIVAVAGYQVGMIENTRRELGQAFNDHALPDGHVNILVQDHRNHNLTNLHVHLESRLERIKGTVTFRDQVRLPRNAQLRIDLYETVRQGVSIPIVSKSLTDFRRTPIEFTLDYDPSLIDPRREYTVHATVVANNQTYYRTHNPYRVITDGYPRVVDLSLYDYNNSQGHHDGGFANNRDEEMEQIVRWFREYLDRDIRNSERQAFSSSVARGESLEQIRAELLAMPEFYTKSGRDDADYIRNLYEVVLNRRPTQQEVNAWLRQLDSHNGLRTDLAREFLAAVSKQR